MKDKDHYYWKAKEQGYASRATYKLQEIQQSQRLMKPGDLVLELGAAPGGWTEIAAQAVAPNGRVVAVDLQPLLIPPHPQIVFLQGDFTDPAVVEKLASLLGEPADLVLSDAAPSTSGIALRDAARSAELCMQCLEIVRLLLKPGGSFLCKVFAGDEEEFLRACRRSFKEVRRLKPDASKKKSREFYLLSRGLF